MPLPPFRPLQNTYSVSVYESQAASDSGSRLPAHACQGEGTAEAGNRSPLWTGIAGR
jgi:hypothetical protein